MWRIGAVGVLIFLSAQVTWAQLNENCTVSVLNRSVRVNPDGTWLLPNIPANFGQVKARATCVQNGVTTFGESDYFTVPPDGAVNLPQILIGSASAIPVSLALTPPLSFTAVGQSIQLVVTATYPGGGTNNVAAASTGTNYTTSNSAIARVSANGLVTAVASGTVVIQAINNGAAGIISASVVLSNVDSDGDGIPDDIEVQLSLNPLDPIDAQKDADRDGLTNIEEYQRATNLHNPDSDGDGLTDGDEVITYKSSPVLTDTDGDGIRDGLEIATGSDPANPLSYNLAAALTRIEVAPSTFSLTVNAIIGQAFQDLTVTGFLKDGFTINLTSTTRGTQYSSSDLNICNFGAPDGRVFAGASGNCTIAINNNGFIVQAVVAVTSFSPTPLSFVTISGFANNVDVNGNFAYVAAGSAGLQVVNVADRTAPNVAGSRAIPGNANGVKVVGNIAYVAAGSSGLQLVDVSNPLLPVIAGAFDTPGDAWDVVVRNNKAYVADGAAGLRIIDVSLPSSPFLLGSIDPAGTQKAVDVDLTRNIAVVASGTAGIQVINVSNPKTPVQIGAVPTGASGDARDVVIKGNFAIVADFQSLTLVDITNPQSPVVRAVTPQTTGGKLNDVAVQGNFSFGADVFFVNGVPIVDISNPANPLPRAILNFASFRDDDGQGIAADGSFVYLAAVQGSASLENGTTGNSRLYIGQYLMLDDRGGIPPTVQITAPTPGSNVIEGGRFSMRVDADDDIAVSQVSFLINGQVVFTDTAAPFEITVDVPIGATSLTLDARATDLGGNTGNAQGVVVNVIPDPGTTVVGRVLYKENPVAGAQVTTAGGRSSNTAADGTFSVTLVPTILGKIVVTVTAAIDGGTRTGSSGAAPVVSGITDVGDIILGNGPLVVVDGVNVSIIDPASLTVLGTTRILTNGSTPAGVAVTPDGNRAIVGTTLNEAYLVDLINISPSVNVTPAIGGFNPAITSDGRFAVLLGTGGGMRSVNIATRSAISFLALRGTGVAITPDNTQVIVTFPEFFGSFFRVLGLSPAGVLSDTGVVLTNTGSGPSGIAIAPNGRLALATNLNSNDVSILRIAAAGNVTLDATRIPVGGRIPYGVAFTPDGRKAYVVGVSSGSPDFGFESITVLNIDANDVVTDSGKRIVLPNGTATSFIAGVQAIAIGVDGKAYISNRDRGTVTVLDTKDPNNPIVGTITVGPGPFGLALPR